MFRVKLSAMDDAGDVLAVGNVSVEGRQGKLYTVHPAFLLVNVPGVVCSIDAYLPDLDVHVGLPCPETAAVGKGDTLTIETNEGYLLMLTPHS